MSDNTLPTYEELYNFLQEHYKANYFISRDASTKGYSRGVTEGVMEHLRLYHIGIIWRHESVTGKAIFFNRNLHVLSQNEIDLYFIGL